MKLEIQKIVEGKEDLVVIELSTDTLSSSSSSSFSSFSGVSTLHTQSTVRQLCDYLSSSSPSASSREQKNPFPERSGMLCNEHKRPIFMDTLLSSLANQRQLYFISTMVPYCHLEIDCPSSSQTLLVEECLQGTLWLDVLQHAMTFFKITDRCNFLWNDELLIPEKTKHTEVVSFSSSSMSLTLTSLSNITFECLSKEYKECIPHEWTVQQTITYLEQKYPTLYLASSSSSSSSGASSLPKRKPLSEEPPEEEKKQKKIGALYAIAVKKTKPFMPYEKIGTLGNVLVLQQDDAIHVDLCCPVANEQQECGWMSIHHTARQYTIWSQQLFRSVLFRQKLQLMISDEKEELNEEQKKIMVPLDHPLPILTKKGPQGPSSSLSLPTDKMHNVLWVMPDKEAQLVQHTQTSKEDWLANFGGGLGAFVKGVTGELGSHYSFEGCALKHSSLVGQTAGETGCTGTTCHYVSVLVQHGCVVRQIPVRPWPTVEQIIESATDEFQLDAFTAQYYLYKQNEEDPLPIKARIECFCYGCNKNLFILRARKDTSQSWQPWLCIGILAITLTWASMQFFQREPSHDPIVNANLGNEAMFTAEETQRLYYTSAMPRSWSLF